MANVEAGDDTLSPNLASGTLSAPNDGVPAAERSFSESAKRFEKTVHDGLEQLRAQSRAYADTAGQQLDEAQRYVVDRVKERPLAATGAAVGVGVILGLLLSGGRRR